jgi:uncharacterized protein YukE
MTGFAARPDPLYGSGQQYQAVHDELASIYDRLTGALDATGQFWGGDLPGQNFARDYCPKAVSQLQQMGATGDGLQSVIDGVASWAKNYVEADAAVAQSTPSAG